MGTRTAVDLVVVGAGAAGLAAAKTGRELGLETIVFEAMDRSGGRAFTDTDAFPFPWDAGCHWLHSASINPFTAYADELGFRYQKSDTPWGLWRDGGEVSEAELAAIDAYIDGALSAAVRCGREGIDVSLAEVVDPEGPGFEVLRLDIDNEWGVDFRAASTLDIARYRDTDENWPVIDGYGALVARVAAGVPIELKTPVEAIDWSGAELRVTTPRGTVAAKAAIVTVSTTVLADGVISFDPPLPAWKQDAYAAVPLGRADKVALLLEEQALTDVPEHNLVVPIGAEQMISLRFRPYGRHLVDAYLAGAVSAELAAEGEAAMIEVTTDAMVSILGSGVRRHVTRTAVSNWANEPYIRGAYAAAMPGQAERRNDLRRPVDGRLFFAGEACSPEFFSTCHGAWQTGATAARDVAQLLGHATSSE